jgi:hypothetical protein
LRDTLSSALRASNSVLQPCILAEAEEKLWSMRGAMKNKNEENERGMKRHRSKSAQRKTGFGAE